MDEILSTFFGLEIGSRALDTNQVAMDVTGNNIANVNTDGYSRQVVTMSATDPYTIPAFDSPVSAGQLSTGVQVDQVKRMRDSFTDGMYRDQTTQQNYWNSETDVLNKIQGIIGEPSDSGLNNSLQQFFSAWQEMSKDPGMSNRAVLVQDTNALTDTFHQLSGDLNQINQYINTTLTAQVEQVNSIAAQIADLNTQISKVEEGQVVQSSSGSSIVKQNNANDLRDKRDLLLDQLSGFGNISISEDPVSGMDTVTFGNTQLVKGDAVTNLTTGTDAQGNITVNDVFTSGSIQGYTDVRDQNLQQQQSNLDKLASELIYQVNQVHQQGVDLNGNMGGAFFTGSNASDIQLSSAIATDTSLIAAATPPAGYPTNLPASGDGSNALAMVNLQNTLAPHTGGLVDPSNPNATVTLQSYWQTSVFNLGLQAQEASKQNSNHQLLLKQLDNTRQATEGVSLDEEMTNMVKYQHGYDAAARVIDVMNQMLDTIVNGLGVGTA